MKNFKKIMVSLIIICLIGALSVAGINFGMIAYVKPNVLTVDEASELENVDCIIVLGCLVKDGDKPSHMLSDRLTVGVELYKSGASPKILMSGDHGRKNYDEVNAMRAFALENDVPSEDIFMDHAGFSTYETMYRARDVFKAEKVLIVTQGYHMYRALYDAKRLGLEAYGVTSDLRNYGSPIYNAVRESAARCKDFIWCIFKPEPTYLGEAIPVSGDGSVTMDK